MNWTYYGDPRPDVQALVHPAGRRILDVGCGEGCLAAALKAAGAARVVGVELDQRAAAVARERLDDVVHGRAEEAGDALAGQTFDYLIFADVLEHLPEPERVLRDLLRLLAPGGRVVVSVPNMRFYLVLARLAADRWAYTDSGIRDRTHLRIFTRRSLERMLAEAGLELEVLRRNPRLVEDQSDIGRLGAVATRIVRRVVAPVLFRDLLAYQYLAVARLDRHG